MSLLVPRLEIEARDISCCNPRDHIVYQNGKFVLKQKTCCISSCFGPTQSERELNKRTWETFEKALLDFYKEPKIVMPALVLAQVPDHKEEGNPLTVKLYNVITNNLEKSVRIY